jgi:hypothetical protein
MVFMGFLFLSPQRFRFCSIVERIALGREVDLDQQLSIPVCDA